MLYEGEWVIENEYGCIDDEGDEIVICSNEELTEAVDVMRMMQSEDTAMKCILLR